MLAPMLVFAILLLPDRVSAEEARRLLPSAYTHVQLQLPSTWIFFDARDLTDDGRAGGYVRVSEFTNPIDVPVVWGVDGHPAIQPVLAPYAQGYVVGFGQVGEPVGGVLFEGSSYTVPGRWASSAFVPYQHFGYGGAIWDGTQGSYIGETGSLDLHDGSYLARLTLWDVDGSPHRPTGLDEPRRFTRVQSMNRAGVYVGNTLDRAISPTRPQGFVGQGLSAQILSFPGFDVRNALDVNDENWIVGGWSPDGVTDRGFVGRAFTNEARDLGLLPGYPEVFPKGINNHGEIVGTASLGVTTDIALYWPAGVAAPIDLNTLVTIPGEPRLVEAMDINDAGQILARGTGGYYIFTPLPEPIALPCISTVAFVALRRRRAGTADR
jgi:hypothetical protein